MKNTQNKDNFLAIKEISEFTQHLSKLISGELDFDHGYNIEFKKWQAESGDHWQCDSLSSAQKNYWWHGSYKENKSKLDELTLGIKSAVDQVNNTDAFYWSMRILEWGDVYKGCTKYILDNYSQGSLCQKIKEATNILESSEYKLKRFDQVDLRMDSGLTKIYSLASSSSLIFDSRVAAALSLIAYRLFPLEIHDKLKKLKAFACGTSVSSEKKRSYIKGKKVFSPYLNPKNQAHYNLVTNWIVDEAINLAISNDSAKLHQLWGTSSKTELLRAIEAALFMVGSDISAG